MRDLAILLMISASLGVPVGLIFASQVSLGVAILAVCCFLAILARVCQAGHHHREVMRALSGQQPGPRPY